jgi:hypothetical protein
MAVGGFVTKRLAAAEYGGGALETREKPLNIAQNADAYEE